MVEGLRFFAARAGVARRSSPWPPPTPLFPHLISPPAPLKTNARECKAEVARDANRAATDYRLNWRLKRACAADIEQLCAGQCPANSSAPCGGLVLQCLTERADNITAKECQEVRPWVRLKKGARALGSQSTHSGPNVGSLAGLGLIPIN